MYASCGPTAPFILDALTDMQTKPTHKILTITPEVKEKKKKKERGKKKKEKKKKKRKEKKKEKITSSGLNRFPSLNM